MMCSQDFLSLNPQAPVTQGTSSNHSHKKRRKKQAHSPPSALSIGPRNIRVTIETPPLPLVGREVEAEQLKVGDLVAENSRETRASKATGAASVFLRRDLGKGRLT
jgi:hypothetical protein